MRFGVEDLPAAKRFLWPALPEVPRYEYAGQLLGQENFPLADSARPHGVKKALWWAIGLDPETGLRKSEKRIELVRPQSGAVDAKGRILVTDIGLQGIMVFDAGAGKLSVWEQATQFVHFNTPVGIAIGPEGRVLVTDAELGKVFVLSSEGEPISEFGGEELVRPTGIARDPKSGTVYVADTRTHDIKVFDDQGKLLNKIGGPGTEPGQFNSPTHIAFANGRLYVSDTLNARIQSFDTDGKPLLNFGQRGIQVGNLVRPKGVAVDKDDNIYVIESFHDYLLIYDGSGEFLLPIGGTGKKIGQFYLPGGVWTDNQERIFVADMFNGRVVVFRFLGD
ncbi:MAG: 6-bladed beta-propeller [Magnetococcales bacterium]|nr:6-bladed beta-propeller [Magnetococcales bacterium]MBF0157168.1 6-bladed beta-propeller [Magnetococcales bacterium]